MPCFILYAFSLSGRSNVIAVTTAEDDWTAVKKFHCEAVHPSTLQRDDMMVIGMRLPQMNNGGWLQCRMSSEAGSIDALIADFKLKDSPLLRGSLGDADALVVAEAPFLP